MFVCGWVGVFQPSGCSFGKSEKIRTPQYYGLNVAICILLLLLIPTSARLLLGNAYLYSIILKFDHNVIYKWYHRVYVFSLGYVHLSGWLGGSPSNRTLFV